MNNSKEHLVSSTLKDGVVINILVYCENRSEAVFLAGRSLQEFVLENPHQDRIKSEIINMQVSEFSHDLTRKGYEIKGVYIYTPEDIS